MTQIDAERAEESKGAKKNLCFLWVSVLSVFFLLCQSVDVFLRNLRNLWFLLF